MEVFFTTLFLLPFASIDGKDNHLLQLENNPSQQKPRRIEIINSESWILLFHDRANARNGNNRYRLGQNG